MNNYLILSTKGLYKNSFVPIIIYVIGAVCFFAMFPHALSTPVGYIATFLVLLLFLMPFINSINMKRSYVELYENFVVGQSIPESPLKNNSSVKFTLRYEDIYNVEIQDKTVKLYFIGGSYTVQANGVESKVVNIIQSQKHRLLQSNYYPL